MKLKDLRLQIRKILNEMATYPIMEEELPGTGEFGTATNRQRWALYLLTKKDYRKINVSRKKLHNLLVNLIRKKGIPNLLMKKRKVYGSF